MLRLIVSQEITDVSDMLTASIIRVYQAISPDDGGSTNL
jgi:hypothetical protein